MGVFLIPFTLLAFLPSRDEDLELIYLSLLKAHFDWKTPKASDFNYYTTLADLRISPDVLTSVVKTTVEVQSRLNGMFAAHARRRHYRFTMTTLSSLLGWVLLGIVWNLLLLLTSFLVW